MVNYIGETQESKQKNKRILYLIFDPSPSAIVRAETYKDHFFKSGYTVTFYKCYSIFFNDLENKVAKFEIGFITKIFKKLNILSINFKKLLLLSQVKYYQGIVIIKYSSGKYVNAIKKRSNAKLLYDFDDAVWLDSFLGASQFEKIIKAVDYVSCDNDYLADKAKQFNTNTFVVKGPSQVEKFISKTFSKTDGEIILGWVGSPHTLFYLYAIYDVLESLGNQYEHVKLRIVGSGNDKTRVPYFEKIKYELIPNYDEKKMIEEVSKFDIGIYPLFNNELSYGRGFLKATIYMSAGVPVICTRNIINQLLIEDGRNGLLASNSEDWYSKLSDLIKSKELREKIGKTGQKEMLENFSIEKCFSDLKINFLNKML